MSNQKIPILSHFQIENCIFFDGQKCDFTKIPRPFHIVSEVKRGNAVFTSANKTITLKEGDVFFIPKGETYRSEWSGGDVVYCTSVFFSFEPGNDPTEERAYELEKIDGEPKKRISEILNTLLSSKEKNKFLDFKFLGDFFTLCQALFDNVEYSQRNSNTYAIQKAIDYINENSDKDISVKQLAEMCNFSESRFYHVFKELMGVSPINYKHKAAINQARLYLGSEHCYTIEEVSDKCGFSSSIYFRRIFKKITGKSPREYKKESMM